jgi:hypothetical protein
LPASRGEIVELASGVLFRRSGYLLSACNRTGEIVELASGVLFRGTAFQAVHPPLRVAN